jgi:hypothetical protein
LRFPVASGESISNYNGLCLDNGQWKKALANGLRQPFVAFAMSGENWVSGEYCRGIHQGTITNPAWSLGLSGEVYLSNSGEATKTKPATYAQVIGAVVNNTTLLVLVGNIQ